MIGQETIARVESIEPLTDSIIKLILAPETFIDYEAGQYLQIQLGHELLAYSIANAPLGSQKYELHIRHAANNAMNQKLFAEIKTKGSLELRLPFGDCCLSRLEKSRSLVFIAGGTGFAPIKAMIEQLLATSDARLFELYWSTRSQSDLYMDSKVIEWQGHVKNFRYFSLYPKTKKNHENVAALVLKRLRKDLPLFQFVISGPFDMVYATTDALIAGGVKKNQLFSDAYSFITQGEP